MTVHLRSETSILQARPLDVPTAGQRASRIPVPHVLPQVLRPFRGPARKPPDCREPRRRNGIPRCPRTALRGVEGGGRGGNSWMREAHRGEGLPEKVANEVTARHGGVGRRVCLDTEETAGSRVPTGSCVGPESRGECRVIIPIMQRPLHRISSDRRCGGRRLSRPAIALTCRFMGSSLVSSWWASWVASVSIP